MVIRSYLYFVNLKKIKRDLKRRQFEATLTVDGVALNTIKSD